MSLRWEEVATVKIHESCGGRGRWVVAINTPDVGYTDEWLACGADRVVVELIVPIEVRGEEHGFKGAFDILDEVLKAPKDELAELEWDCELMFDENQRRLRSEIVDDYHGGQDVD